MKVRLLANENIPASSISLLRSAGVDVLSIAQSHPGMSDSEVLTLAREHSRWLLTYDRDYGVLVFERGLEPPPAILLLRMESQPSTRAAELVLPLLEAPEEIDGYLVVVGERAMRRRPLRT